MRAWDTARLAFKSLYRGWSSVIVAGIAMSVVCFAFSGAILLSVNAEKQKPCELTVQATEPMKLSDAAIVELKKITHITAATASVEVPVTLKCGKYTASITLHGIDQGYLRGGFSYGGAFPDASVMPYIVLNGAAVKEFVDRGNPPRSDQTDYSPAINWANAKISLSFDENSAASTTSKVCGILKGKDEDEEPAGYISLSVAKELLRIQKMPGEYTSAAVRIKSVGHAKDVVKKLGGMGYLVSDPSLAMQTQWERLEMEMTNLILTGAIGLLCFSFLIAAVDRGSLIAQHGQLDLMRWIGMPLSKIKRMHLVKTLMISASGVALGLALCCTIPSFVPEEQMATSVFALPVPALVAAVVGVACSGLFSIPVGYAFQKLKNMH